MWRTVKSSLVVLVLLSIWSCQQPAAEPEPQEETASAPAEAAAPPPPEERLATTIREDLTEVIAELNEKGEYNCCVQPACMWCALHEGDCECFNNLQEGEEVCPGCGLGWHNGQGAVDGVDADDVKWNITHEHGEGGHGH